MFRLSAEKVFLKAGWPEEVANACTCNVVDLNPCFLFNET